MPETIPTDAAPRRQAPAGRRRLPLVLFPPSPLAAGVLGLLGSTAPDMRPDLGIGYGEVATLYVAQTLGTVLGALAVGRSDRRLLRPAPMCLAAAAALLVATAGAIPVLVVAMGAVGFATYALNARAQAELSSVAGDRRARALSLFHVGGGAGAFLAPLAFAAFLRAGASWRAGFALIAAGLLLYAPWARRWGRRAMPRMSLHLGRLPARARWALCVAALSLAIQNVVPLWLPQLLRDDFGLSVAAASATNGIYMAALFVTRLGVAAFLPRLREGRVLPVCVVAVTAGLVLLGAAPGAVPVMVAGALIGGGVGPILALGIARLASLSGDDRLASSATMALGAASAIVMPAAVVALQPLVGLQLAVASLALPAGVVVVGEWRSRPAAERGS